MASRDSVIPIWEEQAKAGVLTITDTKVTRFWITLGQACEFPWNKLESMEVGEGFIPELKSCSVNVLAVVIGTSVRSNPEFRIIGVRQGEKLREILGPNYFSNDPKRLMTYEEVRTLYESLHRGR